MESSSPLPHDETKPNIEFASSPEMTVFGVPGAVVQITSNLGDHSLND